MQGVRGDYFFVVGGIIFECVGKFFWVMIYIHLFINKELIW